MASIVHVQGLRKRFRGAARPALDGVNLQVQAGERVALIGASGSGKSTLLRSLCGLETIEQGEVRLFDRRLQADGLLAPEVRELRRQVGIVFQQFNLVGRLSVMQNVLAGRAAALPLWRGLLQRWPQEERVAALQVLDAVGLSEQAFQRASTLSGGQQQRAAVARSLLQGAQLLLADEPVASLDPASTVRVMELLMQLNRERGITLIVSLHHVALARRYCERALALRDGAVVFDGPTRELTPAFLQQLYGTAAEELIDEPAHELAHALAPPPHPLNLQLAAAA
ncbi:MAG: phosphonate ABC transporter ATP-binding protein [Burkholderiales bacterium]